jgi:N-acetylglucosaminyl-diphospho-decaprenol L-rhamnosyltransferase
VSGVSAVVVDYDIGEPLASCVASLLAEGVASVVVVENGDAERARAILGPLGAERCRLFGTGRNLGYGGGANRGIAASGDSPYVLVCNSDLTVRSGSVEHLARALDEHPAWAIVGPTILDAEGDVYPTGRRFPSMADAAGHALFGSVWPENPFTRRYRNQDSAPGTRGADWVSGACFLARRAALEELGGFDEAYFMFCEEMDLCWRAHQAGWGVAVEPAAAVHHLGSVMVRRRPYRMLVAHHRGALRFARRSTLGWRRIALPFGAAVLGVRFLGAVAAQALAREP